MTCPELDLSNKVSVITGGTSGIGLAIAKTFIEHHSDAAIIGRDKKKGKAVSEQLDKIGDAKCIFYQCDVGKPGKVKNTCNKILEKFSKADILVLNAGTEFTEPISETEIDNWERVISVNLGGPFYFIKYLISSMISREKGNIIIISSVASLTGAGGGMHYAASKAGLRGIAGRINYKLLSKGIRANVISPGVIDTPMLRKKYPDNQKVNKMLASQIPLGRIGAPKDIANLALFLASDISEYICGQDIFVDGGRTFFRKPKGSL